MSTDLTGRAPPARCGLDTVLLLEQWGIWARREVGLSLGYPKLSMDRHSARGGKSLLIGEELAFYVDWCVSQIENQRARDALVLMYVRRRSYRKLMGELCCEYAVAKSLVRLGESDVAQALED